MNDDTTESETMREAEVVARAMKAIEAARAELGQEATDDAVEDRALEIMMEEDGRIQPKPPRPSPRTLN